MAPIKAAVSSRFAANFGPLSLLLADSLLLCCAGDALGVMSAQPMVAILARYASRFSVRALDFRVDSSLLWVGAALAVVAAVSSRGGRARLAFGSWRMTSQPEVTLSRGLRRRCAEVLFEEIAVNSSVRSAGACLVRAEGAS
jgi:hypothetical protein